MTTFECESLASSALIALLHRYANNSAYKSQKSETIRKQVSAIVYYYPRSLYF
jgi:hypothetical protein